MSNQDRRWNVHAYGWADTDAGKVWVGIDEQELHDLMADMAVLLRRFGGHVIFATRREKVDTEPDRWETTMIGVEWRSGAGAPKPKLAAVSNGVVEEPVAAD